MYIILILNKSPTVALVLLAAQRQRVDAPRRQRLRVATPHPQRVAATRRQLHV